MRKPRPHEPGVLPIERPLRARSGFVASLLLAAALSPLQALVGDVNLDDEVTKADSDLIANFIVGNVSSLPSPDNADVNRDGKVDVADGLIILQFVRGLRENLGGPPLQVTAVNPSDGQRGVPATALINVYFSNPIATGTAKGESVRLTDIASGLPVPLDLAFSQGNLVATLKPRAALESSRDYEVQVSTGLRDKTGSRLAALFRSRFTTAGTGSLEKVAGDNQTALISSLLPIPLAVRARGPSLEPLAGVPLTFKVEMGDGKLYPSGLRSQELVTDSEGLAAVPWSFGGQVATQTVVVSGAGLSNTITFSGFSRPRNAVLLRVVSGSNQNSSPGDTLALPLIVKSMDEGGNAVEGTSVTFSLSQGQGNFLGQPQAMRVTDSSGMAESSFAIGLTTGFVQVQASFDGMQGRAPIFSIRSLEGRPATPTAIVGTVINERNELLPGIRVYITTPVYMRVLTDQNGSFRLEPVLPIAQTLTVDGFRSGLVNGKAYPRVSYPITAIEGRDNSIGMPAILPALDPESFVDVSETQGGTLTLRSNPLWKLVLQPGQAKFADGTRTGRLQVQFVPPDKIPMPVSEGKISRFFDTVQPPNAIFDPPAYVTFPNVDNLPPGTITDIFTLDYVSGAFLKTGRGRVTEDGTVVESLPGEGLTQGGWHLAAPPVPEPQTLMCGQAPTGCQFSFAGESGTAASPWCIRTPISASVAAAPPPQAPPLPPKGPRGRCRTGGGNGPGDGSGDDGFDDPDNPFFRCNKIADEPAPDGGRRCLYKCKIFDFEWTFEWKSPPGFGCLF